MSERLTLYGGVTWNVFTSTEEDGEDFAPWSVYDSKSGGTWVRMWPGVMIGFRL